MRDDLLDAEAAIDWAVSDLPIFQQRINAWLGDKPYTLFRDFDSDATKQIIRLRNVKPIPRPLNAEAGIIIHSIRSSLDILTVALAERNGVVAPKDVYFPVWNDVAAFNDPRNPTIKKIKRLSVADQLAIKNLKPYAGGDDLLFALHKLDLTRKHKRLLTAHPVPKMIAVSPSSLKQGLQFVPAWNGFKEDAILAITGRDATDSNIDMTFDVRIADSGPITNKGVVAALLDFANLAYKIIRVFDIP